MWIENLLFTPWTHIRLELSNVLMQIVLLLTTFRFIAIDFIYNTGHFLLFPHQSNVLFTQCVPSLKARHCYPVLLCLRELLRHPSTCSYKYRKPPHHLPGTPQPAPKLPHAQQIAQQPREGHRGWRQQRGRLRPVRQVALNPVYVAACVGGVINANRKGKTKVISF